MTEIMTSLMDALARLFELGGPVVLLLLALSVISAGTAVYKFWQFSAARVGRHDQLKRGLSSLDAGDRARAAAAFQRSRSHLAPILTRATEGETTTDHAARLEAEAEENFANLERGFPVLDSIAQIAPLLGLFGTVLGMIDAFQALQSAGASVDPSILAGGIWVALLTTAAGLAVAMPTSIILTFLETRVSADRGFAQVALARARAPEHSGHA